MEQSEESKWEQEAERPRPQHRRRPVLPFLLLAAVVALVAAVALAVEVSAEVGEIGGARQPADLQLAALAAADAVRGGAEVQVDVAVRRLAQAAAVRFTQLLAAQLGRRGHIEQVPAQRSPEIRVDVGAADLRRRKQAVREELERRREKRAWPELI